MKKWFQIQIWEYFLVAILVAICVQCWSLCPSYVDTVCIVSIWITCVFRLRIPLSPKPFAIHIGIMSLTILCSLQYCISGEAGWWIAPYCSAGGAIWGCILSGAFYALWNSFYYLYHMAQKFRHHSREPSFRENPGAHDWYVESEDILAGRR